MRKPAISLLLLFAALSARAADSVPVPPPSETPAEILVSGRTSTPKKITIVPVGKTIPKTYSEYLVKNTDGFGWYVSQHYALKTDYNEKKARYYLTLLEMSYPHYLEHFGREPDGIANTRMAVCYASSEAQLKKAFASDGAKVTIDFGGITLERFKCAYQFPTGDMDYQLDYILIHECAHLFQMCLTGTCRTMPEWYIEGVADAVSSHISEAGKNRFTLNVLDKGVIHNYFDGPLEKVKSGEVTAQSAAKNPTRRTNFLLFHYFNDDPARLQQFRIWRDEILYDHSQSKTRHEIVLQQIFGPWDKINSDFKTWCAGKQNTFHYVEWGWEQESSTFWSYGFAEKGKLSQMDVNLIPGHTPKYDPYRMDWPFDPSVPEIIGAVERGVVEPSLACVVDFSRYPKKGRAGFGVGVISPPKDPDKRGKDQPPTEPANPNEKYGFVKVMIDSERTLTLDGEDLGLEKKFVSLPENLIASAAAAGRRYGLNAKIAKDALIVSVRAKDPKKETLDSFEATLPLNNVARERLLNRPLTLLSRDGRHGVTPYFDDRRRPEPDLTVAAPPNRWRNPGDRALHALFAAAWALGDKAPDALPALRDKMSQAADKESSVQNGALDEFKKSAPALLENIRAGDADDALKKKATEVVDEALKFYSSQK